MAPVDIDRLSVLSTAMAQIPGDGVLSSIDRVCIAAVDRLSLMANGELLGTAGVSESGVAAVQELQLNLGEGPCVDAWTSGEPTFETDLAEPAIVRWPAFVPAGIRSVFALPLALGAIRIGVLALYRDVSGSAPRVARTARAAYSS
jgi:hypothetical protein